MNIKNIKSFIEFYKFLGITDCISPVQRNKMKVKVDHEKNIKKMKESKKTEKIIESKLAAINNLKSLLHVFTTTYIWFKTMNVWSISLIN